MPREAWSAKRERQYEHIKEGLRRTRRVEDTAEEIAARTVNKERARSGEARDLEPTSTRRHLVRPARRPALARGPGGRTKAQLYQEAKDSIEGRSRMTKAQLQRAVDRD